MNDTTESVVFNEEFPSPVHFSHRISWTVVGWVVYVGRRTYAVAVPIGIIGNILSIAALSKQLKANQAYLHQVNVIGNDLVALLFFVVASTGDWGFGVWEGEFLRSKFLLKLFFLAYPFFSVLSTSGMVNLVGVSADRLYALHQPMKYRNLNKKRLAISLWISSVGIGLVTGFHNMFQMKAVFNETTGMYRLENDFEFNSMQIVAAMEYLRLAVRLSSIVLVFLLAVLTSKKYREVKKKQVTLNRGKRPAQANSESINEKSLTKLLLGQAVLVLIGYIPVCVFFFFIYGVGIDPFSPLGWLTSMIGQVSSTLTCSLNFIVYVAMSKQFRKAVVSVFTRKDLNAVGPS
ncbi:MAG: G-protein coupled receptor [Gammaproteobacteria bacterium]|nr:G-protein coupled receptor [Gammaproteobacteria bacterium]